MSGRRALHFVFKVGNRNSMMGFLKDTLGMTVLRKYAFCLGNISFICYPIMSLMRLQVMRNLSKVAKLLAMVLMMENGPRQ